MGTTIHQEIKFVGENKHEKSGRMWKSVEISIYLIFASHDMFP